MDDSSNTPEFYQFSIGYNFSMVILRSETCRRRGMKVFHAKPHFYFFFSRRTKSSSYGKSKSRERVTEFFVWGFFLPEYVI